MGRAVSFERPYFHLAEALAAELGLASQRLLGDEAVGACGAGVDLVFDQVGQFEHINEADGDGVIEPLAGAPVIQLDLAVTRQTRALKLAVDNSLIRAVEHRSGYLVA